MRKFLFAIAVFSTVTVNSADKSRLGKEWFKAKHAESGDEFRTIRRVGIGSSIGGTHGVAGINLDLNFTEETTFGLGYGFGSPFKAFSMYIRRYMGTKAFSPYFAGGYSRWTHDGGPDEPVTSSTPNILFDRFLTDEQKKAGKFQKNFLYPALGIQYNQFDGEWAGLAFALEIDFLVDVENLKSGTTGGINCTYFF
ncbi:MAG: hypothetical protein A4S09_09370 [Proteobacteria bacterium SG_bin7]|nr:MAG: hypothetical protein A4S09_09370 [Proteobacteria bacterium SG_bin7]